MVHFGEIMKIVRNLEHEAELDEKREMARIGRHRRVETKAEKMRAKAHPVAKHCVHLVWLAGAGLPAIIFFETLRPLWVKYVETPMSEIMVGNTHVTEYISYFLH